MMEPVQMTNSWSTQPSLPCLQPGYRLGVPLQPAADSFATTLDTAFTRPDLQYPRAMQLPAQQLPPALAHQPPQQYRHAPPAGVAHAYAPHQQDAAAAPPAAATYATATKPAVPRLNLSKHDGLGFGSAGGLDASASARSAASTANSGAGHLQQQQHRAAVTSRASYTQAQAAASSSQQRGGAGGDAEGGSTSVPWESGPITPAQALKRYREYLTNYEQSEILEYPQVYFVGRGVAQKVQGSPHLPKSNHGYDDERGDYECVLHDHISYRYEILGVLGKGSFGQVLKCHDFKTNTQLALKIIRNKKRFHHQALVEVKILDHLKANDGEDAHHIIHMQEYFYFRNHLCITFELLSVNLYEFIKHNNFAGLSLPLIRRFAAQMLRSLKYLRGLGIIHCDLKPENILLKHPNRSVIKIIDFGSSCFLDEKVYTYIQSRFYRSPEVILGLSYGAAIDMWSLGCILAELYTGYPLFPGESEQEQLLCIMEVMGLPPRSLLERASRTKMFFDQRLMPRIVPNSRGKTRTPSSKSLQAVLKCSDAAFLDLLERCLRWNPADRITPDAALQHAWIAEQASSSPAPRQSVGVGLSTTSSTSSSASRHDHSHKAPHTAAAWRKPEDPPVPTTLPALSWAQAQAQQQQQAAAAAAAAAVQQQQQSAAAAAAAAAAAHKAASSAGSMTPEASALALSYLQPGAGGQAAAAGQADGDASIYPRAANGMVTARAMMAGGGAAAQQLLMAQRAALPGAQQQVAAAVAAGGQQRPSPYSSASMASSSSAQGAPAVQMVTPRALLYEGYFLQQPQQQAGAAAAGQQQPAQPQQAAAARQPQQPQQRLHVGHATPPMAAAVGLFSGGSWAAQGARPSAEALVQPPPEQCFFPQLSRR